MSTFYLFQDITIPNSFPLLSETKQIESEAFSIQATITGNGAVSASVSIDVSNDENVFIDDAITITLSGTTKVTDGRGWNQQKWQYARARLTAMSGTNAMLSVILGV